MRKTYGNWQNVEPKAIKLATIKTENLNDEDKYHK